MEGGVVTGGNRVENGGRRGVESNGGRKGW